MWHLYTDHITKLVMWKVISTLIIFVVSYAFVPIPAVALAMTLTTVIANTILHYIYVLLDRVVHVQ